MRIFYDCEFIEDGRTIDLISIGMVREDGEELYLVNEEIGEHGPNSGALYRKIVRHDFLMRNVVPHLPLRSGDGVKPYGGSANVHGGVGNPFFRLDPGSNVVVSKRYIRNAVRDFVLADHVVGPEYDGPPVAELWGYFSAYDYVLLCQLFGPMMALPKDFPMWTNDIQQEHERLLREGTHPTGTLPPQSESLAHNALYDARWNMAAWKSLKIA
jgi:hypothetical protein